MTQPLLQIALDAPSLGQALQDARRAAELVDIIEVGTILACAEGMKAVQILRALYPGHILVCDLKSTDAGAILAQLAFNAGADWLTVSAAAHPATIAAAKKVADECNRRQPEALPREIQMELYGSWTLEDARIWLDLGIRQAIYHRSRDAELAGKGWTEADLERMQELEALGFELSITGGIVPEDIHLFQNIRRAKAFIAGRSLASSEAASTAQALRQAIQRHWAQP